MKTKRGGARPGSGRKKKAPTKVVGFRVLTDKVNEFKAKVNPIAKSCQTL